MKDSNEVAEGIWFEAPTPSRRSNIAAAGREALAMLRQASLLHRDVLPSDPRARSYSGESDCDVVVLLHGMFATAGVLRPLRERIESGTGAVTASFTYAPGTGVVELAERLGELVARVPARSRIHLVGHSLGGLVLRYYVQEMMRDARVAQTICLASPFAGSRHARLLPGLTARDLLPGSDLLTTLQRGSREASQLPHLSIAAANDLMIERGAWLPTGERIVIDAVGHNGLLYHPAAIDAVVRRIREVIAAAGGPGLDASLEDALRFGAGESPEPWQLAGAGSRGPGDPLVGRAFSSTTLSAETPRVSSGP